MLDLFKEGLKLNRSLALLPLQAVRRLVDDRNTGVKQMVDAAEDFVSMPFVAATKAIDNTCRPCPTDRDARQRTSAGGPSWRNIRVNPEVTVFSDVQTGPGERRAVLTVTGLLCGG